MRQLILTIFICVGFVTHSLVYGGALIDGGVGSILDVVVTDDNELVSDVSDLRLYSTPAGGSRISRVEIDANDMHGYGVQITSDRGGRLEFYDGAYPSSAQVGHYIDYTMDLEQGASGVYGTDIPVEGEMRGFDVSEAPYEILFDDNVTESTENAEFFIEIHTTAKLDLFHGVFQDTITVEVRDL